jgi:hypothetical protein
MGIEIGAFLINTALSIGTMLVGSWLSPKKQPEKTIPEDIPQLGQGNPVYGVWGLSFCPGSVLYATPPSLAGHGDDKSTYGILGFSNPDSTAGLIALRINNKIAASRSSIFPIISQTGQTIRNGVTPAGVIYGAITNPSLNILPDELRVKNDLGLIYQMATNTPNPNFSLNGYNGLQYEGLTWVGVNASSRAAYGGVNTRFVMYAKNRVTGGGSASFTIKSDTLVAITTTLGFGAGKDYYSNNYPVNFPRGFFGSKKIYAFDNDHDYAIIGISGESEYIIHSYRPNGAIPAFVGAYSGSDVSGVKFSLTSSVVPNRPVPTPGFFPITIYSTYTPAMTDKVILGERNGKLTEVTLSAPAMPPFKSFGGVVKDVTNTTVYTAAGNFRCYGWGGQLFAQTLADATIVDSTNPGNILLPSADVIGTSETAFTTLSTIIDDLIKNKRPDRTLIDLSTPVTVAGFTSDYDSVDNTIVELCTAYGKIIFEDGEGDYWLTDYPSATPVATFTSKDFLEKPSLELSPEYNQPSQIEFTYRSANDQLSEKVIHIGYSNRFGSTANVKYNLCIDETEARRLAWNVLFLKSHTNTKLTFRTNRSISRAGQVIQYNGDLYLVGNIEVGQDMSFRYTCVNYVPLNEGYTDYMTSGSSVTLEPSIVNTVSPFVISAETRQLTGDPTRMGLFYSNSGGVANVRRNNGDLVNLRSFIPVTGGFTGQVSNFTMKTTNYVHGYDTISIVRTSGNGYSLPASQILRIGQAWVKYGSFTVTGSTYVLSDVSVGIFGSSPQIYGGDFVIDAPVANELLGYTAGGILPLVDQDGLSSVMKSSPEALTTGTPTPFGTVTARYPHGFPVSGVAPAQLMACSYGGVLRVWFSKPGNQDNGFFLNDKIGGVNMGQTQWYFQSGLSFLYGINIPFFQNTLVNAATGIPQGTFMVYQAQLGHTISTPLLYPTGSFTFNGSSY